ncbi:CheR family methyltransferase [Thermodesulfobacteriota bacterium]
MEITARQFNRFSKIVYHKCGINLHHGKQQLLAARLSKRMRSTSISSVAEYLKILENDDQELTHFLDAISTNHTFFFREPHHFEFLGDGHMNIWCAAASSGEEPYSLAIDCLEKGFKPAILATDISTVALAAAERGVYPYDKAKNVASHLLKKHFQKGNGKWEGFIRVKDEVKRMVTFRRYNLLTDPMPDLRFDVIFCRNVLIYFDNPVKEKVINKLYRVLKTKGYFIIGGAESLNNLKHHYKYIKPSIYMKI